MNYNDLVSIDVTKCDNCGKDFRYYQASNFEIPKLCNECDSAIHSGNKNVASSINWQQFLEQKSIKHKADLTVGDIILLDDGKAFDREEKTFKRVVCDGYCGKDEFWGYEEETGKREAWCDNDMFKIIGKQIPI